MSEIARTFTCRNGHLQSQLIESQAGMRLRVTINADGYHDQSYAQVEAWVTALGWKVVHREPYQAVAHLHLHPRDAGVGVDLQSDNRRDILEIEARLLLIALKVLA